MIITKMSALVYFFFILFNSLTVIFGNNHVPVLLWSPTVNLPTVPGLKQINSVAFHEILHDTLAPNQPVVAVFIEEKLSNEDFRKSSDDINAHASLEALTTGSNVAYFPSVTKPLKTIEHLTQNGYSRVEYTGNLPSNTERLLLIVPLSSSSNENNEETVSNVYNELRKQTSNILAIYTGQESIRRRPRRDAEPKEEPFAGLVVRTNTTVLMFESLQYNESAEVATNLTSVSSVENSEPDPNTHIITVTFNEGKVVKFNLSAGAELWSWSIRSLEVEGVTLYSDPIVGAPFKWSYFCGKGVTYAPGAGNKSGFPSLTFTGLQAQAFMDENSFGQAVDCIPYFNIEIWTGLFVVFLMLFILTWGLQMLMDVNTNDRFDDPKGKTITISATD